ncbi:MAG: hypothetical protein QXI16_03525 [Sulfolobaceae archaeon]
MIQSINYQGIVDIVGVILLVSTPIGLVFGISGKLANMFFSMVFGEKRVKL